MPRIHITGGAGFIGSNLVRRLNDLGEIPIVYDNLTERNWRNLRTCQFQLVQLNSFNPEDAKFAYGDILVHLGASVDTKESMGRTLWDNNVLFTEKLFDSFRRDSGRYPIYASSAAVYGSEQIDFSPRTKGLKPLNPYAMTKLYLDNIYGSRNVATGLRFFNVYGPNELHKGDMQSVVSKAIVKSQLGDNRYILFKNSHTNVTPARDFIHVDDVCSVILFFIKHNKAGVFNVGTGVPETFEMITDTLKMDVRYDEIPDELKTHYQYLTHADLISLRDVGYVEQFTSLKDGILKTVETYKENWEK